MIDYISQNPPFITNGFVQFGIHVSQTLDQIEDETDELNFDDLEYEDGNLDGGEYEDPEDSSSDQELDIL